MKHQSKENRVAFYLQFAIFLGTLLLILIILEYGIFGTILGSRDFELVNETQITISGVLDRWESDESAVILIEESNTEIVVPKHNLPIGSRVNSWFQIVMEDDVIEHILIDYEKTKLENKKALQLKQCLIRLREK
ncbi:DUF3006 family protein [Oceanobacillus sp. 143]|uniref:Uncharacterized protein n=1 Tax=Oceanobacillus zhaokaii TaxID=2052660 RepID=A0A345PJS7_9BACI|nr:DUF3006 family protein [Oceanobacillus zhaokaii]AXI10257.1 hypothetical protein CUC15_15535 [Oceanobacillus zhaokaii]QGS69324.1 DUF3006 family protein [Oceanobacillus sp. 143]